MSVYKGKATVVNRPIAELYSRFSDMNLLRRAVEERAGDGISKAGEIKFGDDSLSIVNPQVGEIKFQIVERVEPSRIAFKAVNSPLPLGMSIILKPVTDDSTEVSTEIEVELPAMLRAMLGSKMQHVADEFGAIMSRMNS